MADRVGPLPSIGGIYWWMIDFHHPESADSEESFSPLGKSAEDELGRCFSRDGDG